MLELVIATIVAVAATVGITPLSLARRVMEVFAAAAAVVVGRHPDRGVDGDRLLEVAASRYY